MAIQINGTSVIDNSRNLVNVIGVNATGIVTTSAGTLGSNGNGTRTVSTSDPTGGSNGDVWYKVTA